MSGAGWGRAEGESLLEKLPPGRHRLARNLVREHQRRRILLAGLDVFAERGFAAATVKDLIRAAHVSRATFYEIFADKEACLAALHREVLAWLVGQVADALAEAPDWASKVRVAVLRTVELLSGDPRLAALCAVEAPMASVPSVRLEHERRVAELCRGLRAGRAGGSGEELPAILEPALVSGAIYLIGRAIVHGEGPDVSRLGDELAELMLIPYAD